MMLNVHKHLFQLALVHDITKIPKMAVILT